MPSFHFLLGRLSWESNSHRRDRPRSPTPGPAANVLRWNGNPFPFHGGRDSLGIRGNEKGFSFQRVPWGKEFSFQRSGRAPVCEFATASLLGAQHSQTGTEVSRRVPSHSPHWPHSANGAGAMSPIAAWKSLVLSYFIDLSCVQDLSTPSHLLGRHTADFLEMERNLYSMRVGQGGPGDEST
jgi:hypothetical protein